MRPEELLVVEDLRQDSRFQGNPLVTQAPHLCFYAGAPLIDRNGYALGTIAVVDTKPRALSEPQRLLLRDLSTLAIAALESRQRAIQLSHLNMSDHLSGLANRAQFDRTLDSEIAHVRRTGESFTVLYMDLNEFKRVNDTLGHEAGDEVLIEVSRRMEKQVRTEDLLARIGGDEFGVFMRPSVENPPESLAKRITEVVSTPIILSTGISSALAFRSVVRLIQTRSNPSLHCWLKQINLYTKLHGKNDLLAYLQLKIILAGATTKHPYRHQEMSLWLLSPFHNLPNPQQSYGQLFPVINKSCCSPVPGAGSATMKSQLPSGRGAGARQTV